MYSLRYWYEKKHEDGKVIRLEIHKKNNSAAAMEIGDVVQELSLNIDGGEDNIDAPIVSTSLVMTFVDAYDHKDAKTKKCGNWAEFYTPDATLWKVVLLCKDAGANAFRTLWGGYVTPDSYEEDLTYRGSITIIARDNIGHLADFPFDATGDDYGTISLRELLAEAWVKIESPMALRAYDDWMQTEGVSALDTRLNVSAFKDKSWHEAIEAALYAYGAAMRFVGDNEVMVSPLRYIANFGGSVTQSQPIFMAGATRMLTPAVKRIEETASYDLEAELQPLVKVSDFSGERTLLDRENDIYGYYLSNTEEGKGWLSSDYHTIFFDPSGYGIQEADSVENLKNQMYVVADEDYAYTAEYSRYVLAQSAKVKVTFGTGFMRKRYMGANGLPTGGYYLVPRTGTITKAYFIISVTQNGVKQYLKPNGEWAATPTAFSKANDSGLTEIEHDIDLSDFTGTILLKIEIGGIVATIPYVGISAFSIGTNEAVSLLQTNRVNTNYSEENNVIIKRDPVIAPAYNTTILPSIIKNGIFYLDGVTYKPAKAWAWAGGTPQQMAVYNHLQLLTFYAKPNNVIEGNIVNGDVSRFAHIWQFEGKEHILVSGRYNYISGFIEGAILREFARYESLWGSTGEAQLPATETSEETNKESSASSSSAASTYDNTTVVNIGSGGGGGATNLNDLQDVDVTASVAESVLYFNGTNWVDKTIQSLLAELRAIGDWFYKTDDGKSIGTKFNFFSEQEVSANGLSTGSNGGGGLISQVFGSSAFGTIATESNAATFNAYAIDSLYKRIVSLENKEVDLTGYATEAWVLAKNYITAAALSPYLKTADANSTFATLVALNALSSNVGSLEGDVSTLSSNLNTLKGRFDALDDALNDDVNGKINTWNEIVDFLDEYNGSKDLATILSGMNADIASRLKSSDFDTWKTDVYSPLAARVSTAEGNISTNAKGIADNKTAIATNKSNISANATAITNIGKKVTANEGNIAEILKWFAVDSDGNLYTTYNFYSTKEISANGLSIGSGSSGGGLISQVYGTTAFGTIESESNSATFNAYAIDSLYKRIVSLEGKATAVSFVPALTSGKQIGTLSIDGVSTVLYGVDAYSKADADGTFLKLWGGTISVSGYYGLRLKSTGQDAAALAFENKDSVSGYLMYAGGSDWKVTAANWGATYNLLHSNNYSQYALPLSGGTINGVVRIDTANSDIFFGIRQSGSDKSAFGWSTTDGTYMYSYKSSRVLGIKDDGTPFFGTTSAHYTLLHSGNYYDYALPLTGGTISGNTYIPLKVVGTSVRTSIGFSKDASAFAYLTYNGGSSWAVTNEYYNNEYTLYHSGNFNPANYLPLSGGTISGSGDFAYVQLRIKGASIPNIMFEVGSSEKGAIGWTANEGMRFTNAASSSYLGIKDNGTPHFNGNTLIHSGNIGSYTAGSAYGLHINEVSDVNNGLAQSFFMAGYQASNRPDISQNYATGITLHNNTLGYSYQLAFSTSNTLYSRRKSSSGWDAWKTIAFTDQVMLLDGSNTMGAGAYLKWATAEGQEDYSVYNNGFRLLGYNVSTDNYMGGIHVGNRYGWQLVRDGVDNALKVRYRKIDTSTWLSWKTIAFTDSNVASATKLATARTIWGQSFDGTGNVSGNIQGGKANFTIYGYNSTLASNVNILTHDNNKSLWLGYGMNAEGNATIIAGTGIEFRYGASRGIAAFINSSGNVGIGTSSPAYKLDVSGDIATNQYLRVKAWTGYGSGSCDMWFNGNTTSLNMGSRLKMAYGLTIDSEGANITGAVTMSSTLHVVGVSTFESYLNIQAGIRPNLNDARYVGTSSYRFNEGYINNMYTNAMYVGKGTTYGFKSDGSINATLINATNDIITSARLYAPQLFLGRSAEGIYLTSNSISWHNSSNNWASSLMGFTSTSIIAHQSITANSGVKVASGQAITFLDASGKEHKLTYDSTAGAFKFDGNILVVGDGQFNAIN